MKSTYYIGPDVHYHSHGARRWKRRALTDRCSLVADSRRLCLYLSTARASTPRGAHKFHD
jgi:hypothetical protein